jgi:exodeoxyribonuclease VII small subunit
MKAASKRDLMTNNEQSTRTFEASLEALEQIVRELEQGDLPLEKSLELFEHGIRLSRECQERLSQAERRIEILLRDNQGRPVVSPFEDSHSTSQESPDEE